ncbi:MAG TPA: helix-turn-helix domain-containing protein [Rectinemataceae bacterium]
MESVPLKVLLVHRGEPFPFPLMGTSSLAPPFIYVQVSAKNLVADSGPRLPGGYDAYILPATLFLDLPVSSCKPECIAYGSPEDMFSCFEAGAADFLRDGWLLVEAASRLYRLWRPAFQLGGDRISLSGSGLHILYASGETRRSLELSPWEVGFLRLLFAHPERLVPVRDLESRGRMGTPPKSGSAFSMRVSRLRAKLDGFDRRISPRIVAGGRGSYAWILED